MFDPRGLANQFLNGIMGTPGIDHRWLADATMVQISTMLVYIWKTVGYYCILFVTGIGKIPVSVIEASIIDGANAWQRLTRITMPLLKPTMALVSVMIFTGSLKTFFDAVSLHPTRGAFEAHQRPDAQHLQHGHCRAEFGQGKRHESPSLCHASSPRVDTDPGSRIGGGYVMKAAKGEIRSSKGIVARRAGSFFATFILVAVSCIAIMPFLFMAGASLMPGSDVTSIPYRWIPKSALWSNYLRALQGSDGSWIYLRNIMNSFIVSTTVSCSSIFLASFVGFGLAKYKFRGRNVVFMGIMSTMMIPFEAVMIPLYLTAVKLGLQDSYAGLILPFLTSAFGVFLMRQYLLGFPEELLDAARIDGCSEPRIYRSIVFKNARPAVATLAILAFRGQWDNLLWPLLITQSDRLKDDTVLHCPVHRPISPRTRAR